MFSLLSHDVCESSVKASEHDRTFSVKRQNFIQSKKKRKKKTNMSLLYIADSSDLQIARSNGRAILFPFPVAPFTLRTRMADLLKSSKTREIRCIPGARSQLPQIELSVRLFIQSSAMHAPLSIGPRIRLSTIQVSEYKGLRFVGNFRTLYG